jgi:hypothetical protein
MRIGPFSKLFCQNLTPRSVAENPACLQRGPLAALVFRRGFRPKAHPSLAPINCRIKLRRKLTISASAITPSNKFIILTISSPYKYSVVPPKSSQKPFIFLTSFPSQDHAATPDNITPFPASSSCRFRPTMPPQESVIYISISYCQFRPATPDNITLFPAASALTKISASGIITKSKRMWRNWQTRRLQEPVGLNPWRFDSSHPQSIPCGSGLYFATYPPDAGYFRNTELFNLGGVSGR